MPGRPYQFLLPEAIDARLEQLSGAVRDEGHHVSRSDLVCALIWNFAGDGDAMSQVVRRYLKDLRNAPELKTVPRPPGPCPIVPTPRRSDKPRRPSRISSV
jgi:hypothetical protein